MIELATQTVQICEHCSQYKLLSEVSLPNGRTIDIQQNRSERFTFQEETKNAYSIFARLANGESDFSKSDLSATSPADILGLILSSDNPARLGNQMSTSLNFNITILKNGLNELLTRFPEQERSLIESYTAFASTFLTKILAEISSGERAQMPMRLFEGTQGRINARITIQYNIEQVDEVSLEDLKETICSGKFGKSYFFDTERKLRNMLDKVYNGRTALAMIDYVSHHPDPAWRRAFQGLSYLHFNDVVKWRTSRLDLFPEASKWQEDQDSGEYVNITGAREMILRIVKSCLEYPDNSEIKINEYLDKLNKLIGKLSNQEIQDHPAPFGGTYGTICQSVYYPRGMDPIHDLIKNHPDPRVRQYFSTLQQHHLKNRVNMSDNLDLPNYEMARTVSHELFNMLLKNKKTGGGLDRIEDAPRELSFRKHLSTKLLHGDRTIESIYSNVYSSLVHGVIDYLVNHPDEKTRGKFQDLEPYHFKNISKGIYTSEKEPTNSAGWFRIGNSNSRFPWRNVGLAYRVLTEAITLKLAAGEEIKDIFGTLSETTLSELRGKYGNNYANPLNKVFLRMDHNGHSVYNGEVMDLALGGYLYSQEFLRLIRLNPKICQDYDINAHGLRQELLGLTRPSGGTIMRPHWSRNSQHEQMILPESYWRMNFAHHELESVTSP